MKVLQMPSRAPGAAVDEHAGGCLPQVWATDGNLAIVQAQAAPSAPVEAEETKEARRTPPTCRAVLQPGMAFYRSYTEAMLRRYGVLSMESGRVPSMMGREMFRGKVTSYRVRSFDDVVIFVHDVEGCIRQLQPEQQQLILRVGVQEYTFAEAAGLLHMSLRSVQRRYAEALDELTSVFLERKLLQRLPTDPCQEGGGSARMVSRTPA